MNRFIRPWCVALLFGFGAVMCPFVAQPQEPETPQPLEVPKDIRERLQAAIRQAMAETGERLAETLDQRLAEGLRIPKPAPTPSTVDNPQLEPWARTILAEKYFAGCSPDDARITNGVTLLTLPKPMLDHIRALEWERQMLERFATNKLYMLVKLEAGDTRAVCFENQRIRFERRVTAEQERVIRRLYSLSPWADPVDDRLTKWQAAANSLSASGVLESAIIHANSRDDTRLDSATMERARKNLAAAGDNARFLAVALAALTETEFNAEAAWASVWLLSRMDRMTFNQRDGRTTSDLTVMDAQTFFENVYYALRARHEFPWAKAVAPRDFLYHVLAPRGSNEPLQRWRRHFYGALAPEVGQFKTLEEVVRWLNVLTPALFTYEGEMPFEDVGILSALVIHEGRCEDMVNFEIALQHAIGIPGAHVFTPFWARGDGNHAWIGIPAGDGGVEPNQKMLSLMGCEPHGDPPSLQSYVSSVTAAKIYLIHWDGMADVTPRFTKTVELMLETAAPDGTDAVLAVYNMGDWRVVARTKSARGNLNFGHVGNREDIVLVAQANQQPAQVFVLKADGTLRPLKRSAVVAEFDAAVDTAGALGHLQQGQTYSLQAFTAGGWVSVPIGRDATGGLRFSAERDRLYRLRGPNAVTRPFLVEPHDDGTIEIVKY